MYVGLTILYTWILKPKKTDSILQLLLACAKIGAMITLLNYAYSHTEIMAALATTSELTRKQVILNLLTKNSV
jgi:hypothetical protein